jgi:cytochrome c oxidase cbb3-type subunit 3
MSDLNKQNPPEDPLRPHSFDGIQEYDKRLPNWWLFTLYGTIVFSLFYWLYFHFSGVGGNDYKNLARDLAEIEAAKKSSTSGAVGGEDLLKMSQDPAVVAAGAATFTGYCVACHMPGLRGPDENPTAIGPNLIDDVWIHGGTPDDIRRTITQGVVEKGMLAWGPVLGEQKINELVAFILSKQESPAGAAAP